MTEQLKKKYPEYKFNIIYGDFTIQFPFEINFDLIVDRAAITHNTTEAIKKVIKKIKTHLKPKGKFIGIDWFSTEHSDYKAGDMIPNDIYSKTNYKKGSFAIIGIVHFSKKNHIIELFHDFNIRVLEHKIVKKEIPESEFKIATWNFLAIKRN